MADLKNKRRGGFYWVDKTPYVSVTNVLGIIDKPQLRYWYGKQVYLAMVKDPTLGEKEALSAPYTTSRKAMDRGTTVHSIIEAHKHTGEVIESIPLEFRGFAKGYYDWFNTIKPEIVQNEKTVVSRKYKYAGTLDILMRLNGKLYVLDIKTSKDGAVYDEVELQTSAYINALREEGLEIEGGYALGIGEKGKTTFKGLDYNINTFLHMQAIWLWKNKADCKTVGYSL